MTSKEYCEVCVNHGTPICDKCTVTESMNEITVPTKFIGIQDRAIVKKYKLEDLAAIIINRIESKRPIPIKWVIEFNELWEAVYGRTEEIH